MGIHDSFIRSVHVELTSADVTGLLQTINAAGIAISNLNFVGDLTVQFTVNYRHYQKIQSLIEKRGEDMIILSKEGISWLLLRAMQRPVIVCSFCLLMLFAIILPMRVFVVEVDGNERIPDNMILDAAEKAGIGFGASRRYIRSEEIKNKLLDMMPELQWAGVNTYGCTAVISVRERAVEDAGQKPYTASNFVASCDGVVTSSTVTSGTALYSEGQAVKKGQVLISGYSDCGNFVMTERAQGEIFANTRHVLTAVSLCKTGVRSESVEKQVHYSLCFGKKRINLYKGSGISDSSCVKMVKKYYLTLPGDYELPFSLIIEECISYQILAGNSCTADSEKALSDFAMQYVRSSGIARRINEAQETLETNDGLIILKGIYSCNEMIGREQGVQIGDLHGKTD